MAKKFKNKSKFQMGSTLQDGITQVTGAVTSICFNENGTVQYLLESSKGKDRATNWFDEDRLYDLSSL